MKLFLVRHGQTDWNLAQRFQGQSGIPLNETGRQQAVALADRLAGERFDVIYSSDLQRAHETANIIAKGKFEVKTDARLREVDFGDWQGLTYNAIKETHPDALTAWENNAYRNAPPNGETLGELTARVQSMLNDLLENCKGKNVLLVAHGGMLQSLVCLALNLPSTMYWQFQISMASVSQIAFYPAGAIVNLLNDTSNLSPLPLGHIVGRGLG
jgi:alpha-ribazole phosphatase